MAVELIIPDIGESITEVLIANWLKNPGDLVAVDEPVAELESDKATLELPAPVGGVLGQQLKKPNETAKVGEVIGYIEETSAATASPSAAVEDEKSDSGSATNGQQMTPAARRELAAQGIDPTSIKGTGKGGMILKEDVITTMERRAQPATPAAPLSLPAQQPAASAYIEEEIVPMSPIRRTIARRLLESQQGTAQLTTFNEIDMSAVIALRKKFREPFLERYGIKLGFMSFFVKAAIEALKAYPSVNAEIRGTDIAYKNYFNIGIAVGGGKGLVVPVVLNAERLSFAEIEQTIADFGARAQDNKIGLEELTGGTFTISNGGVYGSMLSTPIINPPQSGVLGMHAIQERPVAVNGEVVVRPMMFVALTYDHRMVDGRESVGFLTRIKDVIEDPARIILEI